MLEFSLVSDNRTFGNMKHAVNIGMAVKDLKDLIGYFKDHIQVLREDYRHESPVYIDSYDMHFQFRALSGSVSEEEKTARFRLLFMYNLGTPEG